MKKASALVVFITGASSGIGKALALEFASRGARVVLTARRKDRLDEIAETLGTERALAITCDVTKREDLDRAVQEAIARYGRIDVVIANAGFGVVGHAAGLKVTDYRRQFETNVFALVETFQASLEALKKTRGIFAATGSVAGYISLPNASAYAMSKFAVRAFCEAIKHEVKRFGVSFVLLSPGFVVSDIRLTNNQGQLQPQAREPLPRYLLLPTDKAARQMATAILKRKPDTIFTWGGKFGVFFQRHFPGLVNFALSRGVSGRSEPLTTPPRS